MVLRVSLTCVAFARLLCSFWCAASCTAPAAAPPADAFVAAARSAAHSAARSAAAIAATMARLAAGRAGLHMPQMLRQTARRKALAKYPWPAGSQKNGRSGAGPGTPAGEAGTGTAPAPCGRLPRTVRNSPCRLDGQSLAGRAGARWHSQALDLVHQPGWKREGGP